MRLTYYDTFLQKIEFCCSGMATLLENGSLRITAKVKYPYIVLNEISNIKYCPKCGKAIHILDGDKEDMEEWVKKLSDDKFVEEYTAISEKIKKGCGSEPFHSGFTEMFHKKYSYSMMESQLRNSIEYRSAELYPLLFGISDRMDKAVEVQLRE